jgi:class 3 adenylate cyclase
VPSAARARSAKRFSSSAWRFGRGLHSGKIELDDDDVAGIAVHIGQRVATHAPANGILVSRTVADLVAGSEFVFYDEGEHELKGVPGTWRLFQVDPQDP